jgi:hypothetical protein
MCGGDPVVLSIDACFVARLVASVGRHCRRMIVCAVVLTMDSVSTLLMRWWGLQQQGFKVVPQEAVHRRPRHDQHMYAFLCIRNRSAQPVFDT